MAESTIGTYLGYEELESNQTSASTLPDSFKLACDITDYPDLDSPAERIETTTLSDKGRTYTKGLKDTAELTFTANFDKSKYSVLEGLADKVRYWVVLFEESKALFYFKGKASVAILGAGVGDVRTMSVTIYPEQAPALESNPYYYDASNATITSTNPA